MGRIRHAKVEADRWRVQAWRVGDERAETYLRLRAETYLRVLVRPPLRPEDINSSELWEVTRAGRILVAAGLLDDDLVDDLRADVGTALTVRSRALLKRHGAGRGTLPTRHRAPARPGGAAGSLRLTPVRQTLSVRSDRAPFDRAPFDLHLLTLVRARSETAIITAIRMYWPEDGSSADLEITGAGVQHFPYDQIGATDDRGAEYRLEFDGDDLTTTWQGVVRLLPPLPPGTRWLDLIADGTNQLLRLDLVARTTEPLASGEATIEESAGLSAAEWLLAAAAESILWETWTRPGPFLQSYLTEITSVLTDVGAIAADSPTPGHLAALCRELGVIGHGITAPPAAGLPGPWASIIAQRKARAAGPPPFLVAPGPDVFTPLGTSLPDIDGTRLTLAALSSAGGESYLYVAASGLREPVERFEPGWRPGLSWWLKDPAGHWHMAMPANYLTRSPDTGVLALRLTPPLATYPDTIEVVVTGTSARLRAVVPVPGAPAPGPGRRSGREGGH
jgi:hypothetical protein